SNTVERFLLRSLHGGSSRFHFHIAFDCRATGSDLFPVHFNDASIACLEWSERFIIANLRDKIIRRIQYIKQVLSWFGKMIFSINSNDIILLVFYGNFSLFMVCDYCYFLYEMLILGIFYTVFSFYINVVSNYLIIYNYDYIYIVFLYNFYIFMVCENCFFLYETFIFVIFFAGFSIFMNVGLSKLIV